MVTDFGSQRTCLREEGCFSGWLTGRNGGRANAGELREARARPHRRPASVPFMWKRRLVSLSLQLSKYFCFPFLGCSQLFCSQLFSRQSNGLELRGGGQLGHPHQMEPE